MSRDILFESSEGYAVTLDRPNELLYIGGGETTLLKVDLKLGTVEVTSPNDISVMSGGRIALDAAKGVDIRTGGDLSMIAEGETIIRGKMVRIN